MITKILTYGCKCDQCGQVWTDENNSPIGFTTKEAMHDTVREDKNWLHYHGKDYCPNCWSVNHLNGNLVLKHVPYPQK